MPVIRETVMVGPQQYKALCFIRDNPNCYAWQLALHLWRDRGPEDSRTGTTIWRPAGDRGGGSLAATLAGALNGKLWKLGLTHGYSGSMRITEEGRKAIAEFEAKAEIIG